METDPGTQKEKGECRWFTQGEYQEFLWEKWGKPKAKAMQEWSFLWANSPSSWKGWQPKSKCATLCVKIR